MQKKARRKLVLATETLRTLDRQDLGGVAGGASGTCWSDCKCTNMSACCGGGGTGIECI